MHRRVARLALLLVVALLAGSTVSCSRGSPGEVRARPAERPLPIPPLAASSVDAQGRRVFDLDVREGTADFGDGPVDGTWGANGDYLGPTLRAERGETVLVNVTNNASAMTTLHWHGMHLPARMDGGPHQMVEPGQTWSPTWTVTQPAATLWYHAHPHGRTAEQIYRGLAGLFILDDPDRAPTGLPDEYGVDDIPLVVQDKAFTPDGALDYRAGSSTAVGFVGDTIVVNGAIAPFLDVGRQVVRLRLLNASTARVYRFAIEDGRSFAVVASDGGLLPEPVVRTEVQLSPAERAEIVVALTPGETTRLVGRPPDLGARVDTDRLFGSEQFPVVELRVAEDAAPGQPTPTTLADLPAADQTDAQGTRTFALGGRVINGRLMDIDRIDEVVPEGRTEVWAVTNQSSQPHNFHVHDGQFRVLTMAGAPPPTELAGWKDTVYVAPTTTVEILVRFDTYTDPQLPYMYHCHLTLHEDQGMMGQFVVVPAASADASRPGTDEPR